MIKMNDDKLILSKFSRGCFLSSVKENEEWNNIEQLYKISKEIYEDIEQLQQQNKLLKHRLETANDYIESRIDNMIPEHYDDLKYIINECDLNSSW